MVNSGACENRVGMQMIRREKLPFCQMAAVSPFFCQAFARLAFIFFVVHLAGGLVLIAFYYNFAAFEVYIMSLFWETWLMFVGCVLLDLQDSKTPRCVHRTWGHDRFHPTLPGEDDNHEVYLFQALASDLSGFGSGWASSSPSLQGFDSEIAVVLLAVCSDRGIRVSQNRRWWSSGFSGSISGRSLHRQRSWGRASQRFGLWKDLSCQHCGHLRKLSTRDPGRVRLKGMFRPTIPYDSNIFQCPQGFGECSSLTWSFCKVCFPLVPKRCSPKSGNG